MPSPNESIEEKAAIESMSPSGPLQRMILAADFLRSEPPTPGCVAWKRRKNPTAKKILLFYLRMGLRDAGPM